MTKLAWGLWGVTTLIAIFALMSAFTTHYEMNKELDDVWENNAMLIESLRQTFEENEMSYKLNWLAP